MGAAAPIIVPALLAATGVAVQAGTAGYQIYQGEKAKGAASDEAAKAQRIAKEQQDALLKQNQKVQEEQKAIIEKQKSEDAAAAAAAIRQQQQRRKMTAGGGFSNRSGTLLTGPRGLSGTGTGTYKSLLGQ